MCGRYATALSQAEWSGLLPVGPGSLELPEPRYNLAPTQGAPVIRELEGERQLEIMRWGLIPAWAKSPEDVRHNLFNARAETVAEKPSFRSAFRARRCLMPSRGFFEWQTRDGVKQPFFISRADGRPLVFAGLWEQWRGEDRQLLSCTMITTAANGFMQQLHHRMPVILEESEQELWLSEGPEELLRPAAEDVLVAWPVARSVGNVRNDSPQLLEPLPVQGRLTD